MRYFLRILSLGHLKPMDMNMKCMKPKCMKPLGRWNNECSIKTNKKIDFSNEDHCGTCGKEIEIYKD